MMFVRRNRRLQFAPEMLFFPLLNRLGTWLWEGSKSDHFGGVEKREGGWWWVYASCIIIADGVLALLSLCPLCPVIAASAGCLSGLLLLVCVPVYQGDVLQPAAGVLTERWAIHLNVTQDGNSCTKYDLMNYNVTSIKSHNVGKVGWQQICKVMSYYCIFSLCFSIF